MSNFNKDDALILSYFNSGEKLAVRYQYFHCEYDENSEISPHFKNFSWNQFTVCIAL